MTNASKLEELDKRIFAIKKTNRDADVTGILLEAFDNAVDNEERVHILSSLASEYQTMSRSDDAEQTIRKAITISPQSPELWIKLAEHFHYHDVDLEKALAVTETAVDKAMDEGNFVRQALGVRVRIATEARHYSVVEKTLRTLLDYEPKPGTIDVKLEGDFLNAIPVGKIDEAVMNAYKEALLGGNHV